MSQYGVSSCVLTNDHLFVMILCCNSGSVVKRHMLAVQLFCPFYINIDI